MPAVRPSRSARPARRLLGSVLALALATGGCAFGEIRWSDPLSRRESLEDAHYHYTRMIRWGQWNKATAFVAGDAVAAFRARLSQLEELRFTDYQLGHVELDEDGTSTVEVTYTAYRASSPYEIEIHETQHWSRGDGVGNDWRVRSEFRGLEPELSAAP